MKLSDSPILGTVTAKYGNSEKKSESNEIKKIDTDKAPKIPVEYSTERTQNGLRTTVTAKYGPREPKMKEQPQELRINERSQEIQINEPSLRFDKSEKVEKHEKKLKEHCDMLDRRDWAIQDMEPKRKGEENLIKGQLTRKPLEEWVKSKAFPIEFGNSTFRLNPSVLISNFLSTFIKEGDGIIGQGPTETRKFVAQILISLSGNINASDMRGFDKEMILGLAKQFRSEGRTLKADILEDFVIGFEKMITKDKVMALHGSDMRNKLQLEIDALKDPTGDPSTFMRNNGTKEISNILLAKGGLALSKEIEVCVNWVAKDGTLKKIDPSISLKASTYTKENLQGTKQAVTRLLTDFSRLLPPTEVKEQLAEYRDLIKQNIGVGGLTEGAAKIMIQRLYSNCVILRLLSPTISGGASELPPIPERQLIAVTILMQNIANNAGTNSWNSEAAKTAYRETCPEVWTMINNILVQYGMPKDCADIPFKG